MERLVRVAVKDQGDYHMAAGEVYEVVVSSKGNAIWPSGELNRDVQSRRDAKT